MLETKTMTEEEVPGLDELFMSAADGDAESWRQLLGKLRDAAGAGLFGRWAEDRREAWLAGTELLLEAIDTDVISDAQVALLHEMAAVGLDMAPLRDMLATVLRSRFSDYADPAGMIAALGVLANEVPIEHVVTRWNVFAELSEGRHCFHAAHGTGQIVEVDAFGNEVRIRFKQARTLTLNVALDSLIILHPHSPVDLLMRGDDSWTKRAAGDKRQLYGALTSSFVPAAENLEVVEAFLVPSAVKAVDFAAFRQVLEGSGAAAPTATEGVMPQRALAEARTLEELRELLRGQANPLLEPGDRDAVTDLLSGSSARRDQAELFGETVGLLWQLTQGGLWLRQLLSERLSAAIGWTDLELFVDLTERMTARLAGAYASAALAAVGPEQFGSLACGLPLRLWPLIQRVLEEEGADNKILRDAIQVTARSGVATADMMLWLWQKKVPETELARDPNLLLRTLARPVKGAFIKAAKDLRKILVRDEDFQRFLVRDGDAATAGAVVRAVETSGVLEPGEKQSFVVRLVRIFPEFRSLVEKRNAVPQRKAAEQVTSMRSYQLRRLELEDIIKVKVPANSRAIAHARSYGDLRENAEYKAAKEEQALLGAKRAELEEALHDIKTLDFTSVKDFNVVVPGSTVELKAEDGATQVFHVLGLWDSEPERHMVSYDTPLGRQLLGQERGALITLPMGDKAHIMDVRALPDDMILWLNHEVEE